MSEFFEAHPYIYKTITQNELIKNNLVIDRNNHLKHLEEFIELEGTFMGNKHMEIDKKNGFGLMLYNDHTYYEGQWQNGMKNGRGIFISEQGSYYCGEWEDDNANGNGIFESENPKVFYQGEWANGQKNGKGEERYEDGSFYIGDFLNGEKNGEGKLSYPNQTVYEGSFVNGMIEGVGKFIGKTHNYEGYWKNGKMHGTGKSVWTNQKGETIAKYIGQYKEGIKQGFGEYTDSKGIIYKANWINGEMNDQGPIVSVKTN